MPILIHLQFPFRGINVFMTPHFTSAIAAFGVVFSTYGAIVASELWFIYRKHFVETALKANALWMTPLMPVIFIMSAVVSGIALCMLTYIVAIEIKKFLAAHKKLPMRIFKQRKR